MREFQNRCFRKVVKNAFDNVPFYHQAFQAKGIYPSEIRGLDDLNKLPIFTKSDLKKIPEVDLISSKKNIKSLKKLTTGGSTGKPFSVYLDENEDAWRKSIYLRANVVCGQKIRDKWLAIIDNQYSNESSRLQKMLGFYVRTIVPITLDRTSRFKAVQNSKVDVLDGFPNALFLLARDYEENGGASIQPKLMFGSGELVDKHTISFLERTFHAPYLDQFGCTEIDRAAWQCAEQSGYHMDVDSVIIQFVDEEGNEVGPDEEGEIVYTSLFNYSFPILRYNIEDVGVPMEGECPCGNKLPLMKVVKGRLNSFLVFPDDQIISPINFIEVLGAFKLEHEIEQYKVIQETKNHLRIFVQKKEPSVDENKTRETLLTNLSMGLPRVTSKPEDVSFDIEFVDEIPHTSRGKLNVVSSLLPEAWAF
jgi:phenylacetate-CoA ligase